MQEERIEVLEARLLKLEKANRRLAFLWAALLALPLLALACEPAAQRTASGRSGVQDVLQARKFELVDRSGKVLGKLGADEAGAMLGLHDGDGRLRVLLAADRTEPALWLYDQSDVGRAILSLVEGEPGLEFFDDQGAVTFSFPMGAR